ncbi:hypothetical protein [Paraburkholderia terrae]|uniref:hypothetical protein n=1 Tax=Paraburkholderia terrae TaxID=311230 RepID=UPI001EE180AB|nr:hypothetical protein [Paraburkholderia terrae]GJH02266.1 hypothetical protein CBA19C8_16935 [Paraburkholderia terrae]
MKGYLGPDQPDPARPGDLITIKHAMLRALAGIHEAETIIRTHAKPSDDYVEALDRLEAARKVLSR